ncbi:riboflavin kinase, putative [Entamoeba invadens IP1]|uniref:riboflavin kinase n=1 Tax=Entamoeba invadens IP1 TaxID=370355 RepID=A0A0A1UDS0_ENTIV|nr:riboflavin kinase, putative [Entamoeba invadens IP1]ELP91936.1 riboflavin kinase, putative [Entamoeba invadens IP1]|eukprot:XP_004258707.1 riboflavin kinase, putative [Entamoeba invadens IP1]
MNDNVIMKLQGTIVKGFQRGRLLGYPTANIFPTSVPDVGVYYGQIFLLDNVYHCAISVGKNPTFALKKTVVEIHVFKDFKGEEFYGEYVKVFILQYLRPMKKVDSIEGLKKMISNDCELIMSRIIPDTPLFKKTDFDWNVN